MNLRLYTILFFGAYVYCGSDFDSKPFPKNKYSNQNRAPPIHFGFNNVNTKSSKHSSATLATATATTSIFNLTALPTEGELSFTFRPGSVQWKAPKKIAFQPNHSQQIELAPVFRLPIDSDDTAAQIRFEWSYVNLRVRPEKVTIDAIGPNRATWSVTVVEGTKTNAIWNLRETPSYSPLVEGQYTLLLHDQRGPDTLPKPGWLLPDDKMRIALYKTEGRHIGQDIKPSECATCFAFAMQDTDSLSSAPTITNYAHMLFLFTIGLLWLLL